MITALSPGLISAAKDVYERLKPTIEKQHPGQYIVIEPISKEYFIAPRLPDALVAAKSKFPDRMFYSARIGSQSTVTFS